MSLTRKTEDDYISLQEKLNKQKWPGKYMFKFIVPNDQDHIGKVLALVINPKAQVRTALSKNGKYASISIVEVMKSSQAIIDRYKEAEKIPGLYSL